MIGKEKLDRISELARKKKDGSITKEELEEQAVLREEYLVAFRKQFRKRLDNIDFIYKD